MVLSDEVKEEIRKQLKDWMKTLIFTHLLSFGVGGTIGFLLGKGYEGAKHAIDKR